MPTLRDRTSFKNIETGVGDKLEEYLKKSEMIYDMAIDHFLYTNFIHKRAFMNPAVLRRLPRLVRSLITPIDRYVGKYFHDDRLRQILEYPMVFLGTSPFEAPAMYSLMSHMDFNQGVYYPDGGLYKITEALLAISKKHGVQYNYSMAATESLYCQRSPDADLWMADDAAVPDSCGVCCKYMAVSIGG